MLFKDLFMCCVLSTVAGESLKEIFTSGLGERMDRALMLLAKQSAAVRVTTGGSSAKVSGAVSKSAVIEVASGVVVEKETTRSGVVEDTSPRDKKRTRDRESGVSRRIVLRRCDESGREGAVKTPVVNDVSDLPPILQPVEPISVRFPTSALDRGS